MCQQAFKELIDDPTIKKCFKFMEHDVVFLFGDLNFKVLNSSYL